LRVERTVVNEEYEYVESNDTVRFPAARSGGTVVQYEYEPFDEWAAVEGASVAATRVRARLSGRVGASDAISVAIGSPEDSDRLRVTVMLYTHLDREGDVISEPSVSRSAVAAAAPRSVTVTLHFADRTHTDTYPVYVGTAIMQNE
ncbi:MAG: hypothetical protein ABEH83_10600, partial [Halobacterium sp.]